MLTGVFSLWQSKYDPAFEEAVYVTAKAATPAAVLDRSSALGPVTQSVRVEYDGVPDYERITRQFGLMSDIRVRLFVPLCLMRVLTSAQGGVGRCAYHGVVPFRIEGRQVYLAPRKSV